MVEVKGRNLGCGFFLVAVREYLWLADCLKEGENRGRNRTASLHGTTECVPVCSYSEVPL